MMTQRDLRIDSHESRRRVARSFMRGLTLAALNVVSLTLAGCGGGSDGGGGAVASATPAVPRFAYLANAGDDTVFIYTVNAATGQLQHNGHVAAGTGPTSVTVDPSGKFAYVANETSNNISAYRIDATTGALTQILCGGGAGCNGNNFLAGTQPFSVITTGAIQ